MHFRRAFWGILIGLITAVFVFSRWRAPSFEITFFNKRDILKSEFFNAKGPNQKNHAIVTNCILGHFNIENDINDYASQKLGVAGLFSEVVNSYLNEVGVDDRFYTIGRTISGTRDFTFYFYHVFSNRNSKLVVFANDYGGIDSEQKIDLASTLEAIAALENFKEEYPDLSSKIDGVISVYKDSQSFRDAEMVYGSNWRSLLSDSSKTLPRYDLEGTHSNWFRGTPESAEEIRARMGYSWTTEWEIIFKPFEVAAQWVQYINFLTLGGAKGREVRVRDEILKAKARGILQYRSSRLDWPIVLAKESNLLEGKEGQFYLQWMDLVAALAKKSNKTLIYYFPENLSVQKSYYDSSYRPQFVVPIQKTLEKYGHIVIDHTRQGELNPSDLILRSHFFASDFSKENKPFHKVGRELNIVGKIKVAKDFLSAISGELNLKADHLMRSEMLTGIPTDGFVAKYISAEELVLQTKGYVRQKWIEQLGPEHDLFFQANGLSPYDHFESVIFPKFANHEVEALWGNTVLRYMCVKGSGECAPQERSGMVFQKIRGFR